MNSNYMSFPYMGNSFQSLGEKLSAFEDFDNTHYDGVTITYVYIGLRKLIGEGGDSLINIYPNHWSVILELSNDKYVCLQLDTTGKIDLRVRNTLRKASLLTWGRARLVRLSCYGACNYNYNFFLDSLTKGKGHWYILLVNDCQNFARRLVGELTGKVVGLFPIEDGPKFNSDE